MVIRYHHIRILEDDFKKLIKYKKSFESITQTFNRVMGRYDELPEEFYILPK